MTSWRWLFFRYESTPGRIGSVYEGVRTGDWIGVGPGVHCRLLPEKEELERARAGAKREPMKRALESNGKTVETVIFPDEGHSLSYVKHHVEFLEKLGGFFDKHIGSPIK